MNNKLAWLLEQKPGISLRNYQIRFGEVLHRKKGTKQYRKGKVPIGKEVKNICRLSKNKARKYK